MHVCDLKWNSAWNWPWQTLAGDIIVDVHQLPPSLHFPSAPHFVSTIIMAVANSQARTLYRQLLRELPSRSPSILANPSPMQKHIRSDISTSDSQPQANQFQRKIEEGEQFLQYLKAQRMYTTLLERYNPGMNMAEEDRVKATGRRVGMEMPIEFLKQGQK